MTVAQFVKDPRALRALRALRSASYRDQKVESELVAAFEPGPGAQQELSRSSAGAQQELE